MCDPKSLSLLYTQRIQEFIQIVYKINQDMPLNFQSVQKYNMFDLLRWYRSFVVVN